MEASVLVAVIAAPTAKWELMCRLMRSVVRILCVHLALVVVFVLLFVRVVFSTWRTALPTPTEKTITQSRLGMMELGLLK